MIVNAEKSGNLPGVLLSIGKIYEEKTENNTKNLSVLLEPILLIFVWIAVAGIAIGVVLPIYSLIGGINSDIDSETSGTNNVVTPTEVVLSTTPTPIGPTPTESISPTVTNTPVPTIQILGKLTVKKTTVGYVNIRNRPSTGGTIVKQAKEGEVYDYLKQQSGWYQIKLDDNNSESWISAQYVSITPN
jgi:Bacterial SH3 domain/Type II secretion system (T2SS), protein F